MTYIVSGGALNSTHSLTHYVCRLVTEITVQADSPPPYVIAGNATADLDFMVLRLVFRRMDFIFLDSFAFPTFVTEVCRL